MARKWWVMLKRCPKCGDPRGDAGGLMCQANGCLLVDGDQPRDAEIARLKAQIDEDNEVILAVREHNRRLRAALAAGPAALRKITDDYDGAAEVVEAAQEAAMKEKP